jgi:glucokinase
MFYLTLGTGLGGAIIADGKLVRGASGFAGELGHTVIEPNGRICRCGMRGCLETVVSGTGIVATARELLQRGGNSSLSNLAEPLTARIVFEHGERGDAMAQQAFEDTGMYLGMACANIINLFNPEAIVVGGGVMVAGEMLLTPARREAQRRAFTAAFEDCKIVQSELLPHAGTIGAAMLARDRQ